MSQQMKRIAVIPGDGIGIEVTAEAIKVLEILNRHCKLGLEMEVFDYGAEKYLATGISMPKEQLEKFGKEYSAIILCALGDPRIPDMSHARDILFGIRFGLDCYVNMRPVKLLDESLCPIKGKKTQDVNFKVFRENSEGGYVGVGGIFKKGTPDEIAIQESVNTFKGVERIIRHAFQFARNNGLDKVTMSDKSNALRYEGDLWQRVFKQVGADFPEIQTDHWYVDALAMQMIRHPEQFQVIVTNNLFGDILTDIGAILQGGLGMAASANINPNGICMFEPVHGSAPDIAGKNIANPFGAILTVGLMLQHFGYNAEAGFIDQAIKQAISNQRTTPDLGGALSTTEAGDGICKTVADLLCNL